MSDNEIRNLLLIIQIQNWDRHVISAHRCRKGDDAAIFPMARSTAAFRPPDFNLGEVFRLEAFDQQEIDRRDLSHNFLERGFHLVAVFMHQCPTAGGGNQDFTGPGLPMAMGILARLVDIEAVMRVLDGGNVIAAFLEGRDKPGQQGCLAVSAPS